YLSGILTLIVLFLIWLENVQRGSRAWTSQSSKNKPTRRIETSTKSGRWFYTAVCLVVLLISFMLPLMQLIYWVSLTWKSVVNSEFVLLIFRSFSLAIGSAVVIATLSIVLLYAVRLSPLKWTRYITRTASLGYAIPGAVIAVGVMIPMMRADRFIIWLTSNQSGMILSGTLVILVVAYIVRFMAVGYNAIDAGFQKSGPYVNEVARSLGSSSFRTLWKIDIPLIKNSIAGAILLTFVDILKELPLTLILRPFNFHTLATKAFDMATNEMIAESANASLIVVLTGIIPIILLNNFIGSRKKTLSNSQLETIEKEMKAEEKQKVHDSV